MIKYYCDACGDEMEDARYGVDILCHITSEDKFGGHVKMIDGDIHRMSGRNERISLCLICYNKVMYKLWDNIQEIKNNK